MACVLHRVAPVGDDRKAVDPLALGGGVGGAARVAPGPHVAQVAVVAQRRVVELADRVVAFVVARNQLAELVQVVHHAAVAHRNAGRRLRGSGIRAIGVLEELTRACAPFVQRVGAGCLAGHRVGRADKLLPGTQHATVALAAVVVEVAESAEAHLLRVLLDQPLGLVVAAVGLAVAFQAARRRRGVAHLDPHRVVARARVVGIHVEDARGGGYLPQQLHLGALRPLQVFDTDRDALAGRERHGEAVDGPDGVATTGPVVDDQNVVDVQAHAVVAPGGGAKDVVARVRRGQGAREARREIVVADTRARAAVAPVVVHSVIVDRQGRRAGHAGVVEVFAQHRAPGAVGAQAHLEASIVDADAQARGAVEGRCAGNFADGQVAIVEQALARMPSFLENGVGDCVDDTPPAGHGPAERIDGGSRCPVEEVAAPLGIVGACALAVGGEPLRIKIALVAAAGAVRLVDAVGDGVGLVQVALVRIEVAKIGAGAGVGIDMRHARCRGPLDRQRQRHIARNLRGGKHRLIRKGRGRSDHRRAQKQAKRGGDAAAQHCQRVMSDACFHGVA